MPSRISSHRPRRPMVARSVLVASAVALFALAVGVPAADRASANGPDFLAHVEDLPLPGGLVEDPDARVSFDKAGVRIVEAAASGDVAPDAVTRFYRETLPSLGWAPVGPGAWQRDGEVLRIAVVEAGPPVRVQFTIAPDGQ